MNYEPVAGTIPHKVLAWLRSMDKVRPGYEASTVEICEGIGIDTDDVSAYMRPARERGVVHTRKAQGARLLFWRIGDGKRDPGMGVLPDPSPPRAPLQPLEEPEPEPSFRTTLWDGHLLAFGMEIRDGVAIFTPAMVRELKRHTDWARAV